MPRWLRRRELSAKKGQQFAVFGTSNGVLPEGLTWVACHRVGRAADNRTVSGQGHRPDGGIDQRVVR